MSPRTALVAAVLAFGGCAHHGNGTGSDPASVALATAVAGGAAVYSRSQGGCYAACPPGTTCNGATGYCDPLPCRGRCGQGEVCDDSGPVPRCRAAADIDITGTQKPPPPRP